MQIRAFMDAIAKIESMQWFISLIKRYNQIFICFYGLRKIEK